MITCTKCDKPPFGRGLCSAHYNQGLRRGYWTTKKCQVCDKPPHAKGYCNYHYRKYVLKGKS